MYKGRLQQAKLSGFLKILNFTAFNTDFLHLIIIIRKNLF